MPTYAIENHKLNVSSIESIEFIEDEPKIKGDPKKLWITIRSISGKVYRDPIESKEHYEIEKTKLIDLIG